MAVAVGSHRKQGASASRPKIAPKRSEVNWPGIYRSAAWLIVLVVAAQVLRWGLIELDQPISEVSVQGELHYVDAREIERLARSHIANGVLTTDLRDIQSRVHEQPWVAQVSVRRKWPGILQIWLQEKVPVARWGENSLLTAEGEIFTPYKDISWISLPLLNGPDKYAHRVLDQFHWFKRDLEELPLEIIAVTQEARGVWAVKVREGNGMQLYLGQKDLETKMRRFKTIYRHALQRQMDNIKSVDMRYSNGAAVDWQMNPQDHKQV